MFNTFVHVPSALKSGILQERTIPLKNHCTQDPTVRTWPRGYKASFMLNSTECEILTARHVKMNYRQIKKFLALSLSVAALTMIINVKMPTIAYN